MCAKLSSETFCKEITPLLVTLAENCSDVFLVLFLQDYFGCKKEKPTQTSCGLDSLPKSCLQHMALSQLRRTAAWHGPYLLIPF